jgi:hypothetical protein
MWITLAACFACSLILIPWASVCRRERYTFTGRLAVDRGNSPFEFHCDQSRRRVLLYQHLHVFQFGFGPVPASPGR